MSKAMNLAKLLSSTGKVEADDLDVGQVGGRRNLIINGGFDVWQRGTSGSHATATSNYDSADRWATYIDTSSTITLSQQAFTLGQTDVPNEPTYYARFNWLGTASSQVKELTQSIEGVRTLAGQTCTLSFYAKAATPTSCLVYLGQIFGSGGGSSNYYTDTINLTTSWQRFEFTTTLSSMSGETIGTNNLLRVGFQFAGTVGNNFDIAQVQLEAGSVATPFEHRSYGEELALCQRYYQVAHYRGNSCTGTYYSYYNRFYGSQVQFSPMRATPSISYQVTDGAFYWVDPGVNAYSGNSTSGFAYNARQGNNKWGSIEFSQAKPAGGSSPSNFSSYRLEASIDFLLDAEL